MVYNTGSNAMTMEISQQHSKLNLNNEKPNFQFFKFEICRVKKESFCHTI